MKPTIITFDIETSGLDPEENEIIQFAAIAESPEGELLETFERKIEFSEELADPKALALNHYDAEVWKAEAVSRLAFCKDFTAFLRPYRGVHRVSGSGRPYSIAQLSGYNAAAFDVKFLQQHFKDHQAFLPCDYRVLDVMQLALWRGYVDDWGVASYKLGDVAKYLGITIPPGLHNALVDVMLTAEIRKKLLA